MSNADVDRNLLFGLLALQNAVITGKQLAMAFSSWTLDKSRRLDDILVQQRFLTSERQAQLQQMVQLYLTLHGGDPIQSLASLNSASSACQELINLGDSDIQASLQPILKNGKTYFDPTISTLDYPGHHTSGVRYECLRAHAKGALGEVSVAMDSELHREVALKEIQRQFADDPQSRERFIQEAEITGGLEHPGIVPVYGLGTYSDGRPFYAMRFIKGDSLKDALAAYHNPESRARSLSSERQLQLRNLLGRFIDICNAIEYAHSRGVLHRDLKPGNIMLGKYGETLVVDWGLAKAVGRKEIATDESTFHLASPLSSSGLTQPGRAIGTPAYMSAEQAAGRLDLIGPASDVYSLGATLYHILTGYPPIDDKEVGIVIQRAQKGDFPPPRQRDQTIPRGLEAVCLKAMALKPDDRYSRARGLADDVEHWLADEPVTATVDTFGERMGRFSRKNQGYMRAGLLGLIIVTIVSMSAVWLIDIERRKTKFEANEKSLLASVNADLAEEKSKLAEREQSAREKADLNAATATRQTELARRHLYAAHMNLAQSCWESSRLGQTVHLLDLYRPASGQEGGSDDYRSFEWHYLDRECHRDWKTLKGHGAAARAVAFSPNGKRLASAGDDEAINIWDVETGEIILTLKGHTSSIFGVAFSPDGKRLASAGNDQIVKIWSTATGEELLTLKGHTDRIWSVAFSPDGSRVASGSEDHTVTIWDLAAARVELKLIGHSHGVNSVAFSPDGKQVASGSNDSTIKLFDTATGLELMTLNGHTGSVWGVAFSPNGRRLASASLDKTIKVWDTITGQGLLRLEGHAAGVWGIAFSPDGARLASASEDQTVKVWDAFTGHEFLTLKGHTELVWSVAFSPEGQRLASGSWDQTVKIWDLNERYHLPNIRQHSLLVSQVQFCPGGARLASWSSNRTVKVWDAITGEDMLSFGDENISTSGSFSSTCAVAISPDGNRLAAAWDDQGIKVWDMVTAQELNSFEGLDIVHSLVFSPNAQKLAYAGKSSTINVRSLATGEMLQSLNGHGGEVLSLAFSPDGNNLASTSLDQTIKVWSVDKGQLILSITGHGGGVWSVAYSPDGKRLVSGSNDRTVKVWDATTGRELLSLMGHTGWVHSVAYSPDGKRLASGSADSTIKVWDAVSGEELIHLSEYPHQITYVSFSPNGRHLASANTNSTVRIWDATPQSLKTYAPPNCVPWHRRQADESEQLSHWFSARFHLLQLLQQIPAGKLERTILNSRLEHVNLELEATIDASELLVKSIEINEQRLAEHPGDLSAQANLSNSCFQMGDLLLEHGQFKSAVRYYLRHQQIWISRSVREPDDSETQNTLAASYDKVGGLYLQLGQSEMALEQFQLQRGIRQKMVGENSQPNEERQRWLQYSHVRFGDTLVILGRDSEAAEFFQKYLEVTKTLAERDPTSEWWMLHLISLHDRIGDTLLRQRLISEAVEAYQQEQTISRKLAESKPSDESVHHNLKSVYIKLGNAEELRFQFAIAHEHYKRGLHLLNAFSSRTTSRRFGKEVAELRMLIANCDDSARAIFDLNFALSRDTSIIPRLLKLRAQAFSAYACSAPDQVPIAIREKWPTPPLPMELLREAILTADKLRTYEPVTSENLYKSSCCFSLCLQTLAKIDVLDKAPLSMTLEAKAIDTLRAAFALGWNDAARAAKDPDLEALRRLPEFKTLLEQLHPKTNSP